MPPHVAAVYDRRRKNEPTLTETPQHKPFPYSGGLRPPKENEFAPFVAAVYDRQIENDSGAHIAPLQETLHAVAAVYDRRASPALTEHCYRTMSLWIICILLFLPSLLFAAPKKDDIQPVDPSVVYDASVKVLRGGTCEVLLRAISPHGYDVKFEILSQPRAGSLSGPQRNSKSSVSYFYTHDGTKNSTQDSFRFKCKSGPQKAWGYAKATILVEEPPARFVADVSALDFGSVFLGESRTKPVRIKNAGGGRLQGRLKISAPWSFAGPVDITLSEGETQKILVTFAPLSTDTQRGSLVFEYGSKPFPEIVLEGQGESRFDAPDKAAFEQRVGVNELRIPITNRTAAQLPICIHCPAPLEAPDAISLAPESTGELLLKLPARPFAEKNSLVTLSDGAATRDIRIQLPPPPSRLEWEIVGKNQLGITTPGRTVSMIANLHNTGSGPARAVIRTAGDGFALANGQQDAFDIPPGEHIIVQAEWKFPETPGAACASLIAQTDGLPPLQALWEADVKPTSAESEASPSRTPRKNRELSDLPELPAPAASPSPTPLKILTKEEQDALRKSRPQNFTHHNPCKPEFHWAAFFPARRTATANVSWTYEGPQPVDFIIQLQRHQRKGFFDKNPFDRTLPTPENLPQKSLEPFWDDLKPADAKIQKLPDGSWQAQVPGLSPGYHVIRLMAKQSNPPRIEGAEFPLFVGDIRLPQPLPWTLPALLVLCAAYLLRKKIRSLFG